MAHGSEIGKVNCVENKFLARFIVARDPIGVKPLYWGSDSAGRQYFASEMKCIVDLCDRELHIFPPGHFYTPGTSFRRYYEPMWLEVRICSLVKSIQSLS